MGTHTQKTLTVMFTDIAGFTRHTGTVSRDAMMKRLARHNALLMPIVAHFDGRIVKSIGDALMVLFESPTNALQCGMLMQHRLREHNTTVPPDEQIEIKVSLNTGEVSVTDDDVFGDPVNVAAKIEKATQPGEIYFTEATFLAMNKAEVPNSFVKAFRPRGAESEEIKLYKVVQDVDDPVYRHVVRDTVIDEAATKERTAALTTASGREAAKWQEAFGRLAERQERSSRRLLVAVGAAVVVLAGVAFAAVSMLRKGGGPDLARALATDTRAYLAAGKVDEARRVVDRYVAEHGTSDAVAALSKEIDEARCSEACARASALLAEGKAEEAAKTLLATEPTERMPAAAKALLARATALGRAQAALASGDAAAAKAAAAEAAGAEPATGETALVIRRADALLAARKALGVAEAERANRALDAIAALSMAYGDDTGDARALALLAEAVAANLHGVARDEGLEAANARLEEVRKRFVHLTAWDGIRREVDLGSLWRYASDPTLRRAWGRWDDEALVERLRTLRAAAEKDGEFAYRLGATLAGVTAKNNLALTMGMDELALAERLAPATIAAHEAQVMAFAKDWLGYDQADGSWGRRVVAERFLTPLEKTVVGGRWAVRGEGADAEPDRAMRANGFAVLAMKGRAKDVGDATRWVLEALRVWVEAGDAPSLTMDHAKTLFALVDADGRARLLRSLKDAADDARAKEGPFGVYGNAPAVLESLWKALEATPAPSK
ncbi:MAG: adenylate/guanylate cyclase domain-containing protein [Planctomycetia bacterium]|nr:adenylate/guanylate cyclase domain-containing protein [Planctomycetia bacterium]